MHSACILEFGGPGEGLGWRILRVKWMVFLNSTHKTEQKAEFSHVKKNSVAILENLNFYIEL